MEMTPAQVQNLLESSSADQIKPRYFIQSIARGSSPGLSYFSSIKIQRGGFLVYGCYGHSYFSHGVDVQFRVGWRADCPTLPSEMDSCLAVFKFFHFRGGKPTPFPMSCSCLPTFLDLGQVVIGADLKLIVEVDNPQASDDFGFTFGAMISELPDNIIAKLSP